VNVIGRRAPIPLFGAGLIEAIEDQTIIALEDPEDRDGDGVSGRAARIHDVATTASASAASVGSRSRRLCSRFREMLIATKWESPTICSQTKWRWVSTRSGSSCAARAAGSRTCATGGPVCAASINSKYSLRLLAPVERGPINDEVRRGRGTLRFARLRDVPHAGVADRSQRESGLHRKPVPLFSDLLHDIGTGDGIEQAAATGDEIRTPALWGLRFRRPLLHDGSAATPADAIARHQREASGSLERYKSASEQDRRLLLIFLNSL